MTYIAFGRLVACTATVVIASAGFAFAEPANPECIAPAQPGGGFDITCKLAQAAQTDAAVLADPLRVSYMPGGIGAVAYITIVGQRPAEAGTIVAFSAGSLLNLAQGKFGEYGENAVRWVASVGADYGAVVVNADSPFTSLTQLMDAIKADPASVILAAGGTIGSQDWMKAALTARAAGIDYKTMGYVPATLLMAMIVARVFGANWWQAASTATVLAVGSYLLFDHALDVVLPTGILGGLL